MIAKKTIKIKTLILIIITKTILTNIIQTDQYDTKLEISCENTIQIKNNFTEILTLSKKDFFINFFKKKIKIDDRNITIPENTLIKKAITVNKEIVIKKKRQWIFYKKENLKKINENLKSKCGNYNLLGGYCIDNKKGFKLAYKNLPLHSYIKIQGFLHFIDFWQGEYVFFKVKNGEGGEDIVYSQKADLKECLRGQNFCGGSFNDPGIGLFFDVVFRHSGDLDINFLANLKEDPCLVSFGISDLSIFFI